MRVPLNGNDEFVSYINMAVNQVSDEFIEFLKPKLKMQKVNVMLGDGTITSSETFDPIEIRNLYSSLLKKLNKWIKSDVSDSKTEDLNRVFFQISITIDKFYIYGYFGIQYHAIPFYRVDKRVLEIQKELINMNQESFESFSTLAVKGNEKIKQELKECGYENLDFEELFTLIFEDNLLMSRLEKIALKHENEFPEIAELNKRRENLLLELNEMIIYLYRITPVKIDYNRLIQGEEGIISYFDIEVIKNKKSGIRDTYIDTKSINNHTTSQIVNELNKVISMLRDSH
ncbi:MAG: hypothetical protein ACE5SW_05330 [Nitrososphaeraceae archaeon]